MSTPKVRKPRELIDRKEVTVVLERIAEQVTDPRARRTELLSTMRTVLTDGQAEVQRRFLEGRGSGQAAFSENTYLMDQIIRLLFDFTIAHVYPPPDNDPKNDETRNMTLLAVGGYGRGEMSPQSDVDLMFLIPRKSGDRVESVAEYMLYILWDMGLKVGHSTRTVEECIKQAKGDLTVRTSLLETRYIWGEKTLYGALTRAFWQQVVNGTHADFIEAKLSERDERHRKLGDSRYVLEPNIKDGKGGLRDLHTLFWLARYIYGVSDMRELVQLGVLTPDAASKFRRARAFLWTVRCHLHYLAERAEERLTFDLQPEMARRMGYTDRKNAMGVERFMKHYFLMAKTVGDLTRIFCAILEEQQKRRPILSLVKVLSRRRNFDGFTLDGGRLTVDDPTIFARDPVTLIRLFRVAQEHNLEIHPEALRLVTENLTEVTRTRDDPAANALFMDILAGGKDPEPTLRTMSESGVFGRFVPDFGQVVAQMQYDMYHVYTTDEHTIRALGLLHKIDNGEFANSIPQANRSIDKIQSKRALYVATLLHDIAKGRNGDHSQLGAEIALILGPRFGLTDEETETVSWLVLHHLAMSRTAFKRDVDDYKTITDFADLVQSVERLRLLFLLTCVDILAVGPNVWNAWKSALLQNLFLRTKDVLTGGFQAAARDARVAGAKKQLSLALTDWPEAQIEAYLDRHYPGYWLSFDFLSQMRHARMIAKADETQHPITVEVRPDTHRSVSEVMVFIEDYPGLFSDIAGAMALVGANILDARITTMVDGMALDTFTVQSLDHKAIAEPGRIERMEAALIGVLSGETSVIKGLSEHSPRLPARTRHITVPPRVIVDNNASKTHTVIEVNGRDRPGLLFSVTRALTSVSVQISSALVSTYGERVVDVFYVKDVFGMKIVHKTKLNQIRAALSAALAETDGAEGGVPTRKSAHKTGQKSGSKSGAKSRQKSRSKVKTVAAE